MLDHPLRIFTGSAHHALAEEVANYLTTPLGKATTTRFADSETHVMVDEVVRGQDIFFVQPCSPPVNENLVELLLYLDAFRRASAHSVSVVIPYFPYARQDRMARGREAISARVVANLLENQGADRVIFVDIHSRTIQGFFNIPVDTLTALPLLADYFHKPEFKNAAIVSPDVGRASMAGRYAALLDLPLVVMHKRRTADGKVMTTHVVGDIRGRRPIIIDDIIAGGSVLKQVDQLYEPEHGAVGKAYLSITHGILLPSAVKRLNDNPNIEKLVVTNTVAIAQEKLADSSKIEVLSIGRMLADTIINIHAGISITDFVRYAKV
jgi:ribose-phosphate pyrophosphokinase